jgi:hypothetical protein
VFDLVEPVFTSSTASHHRPDSNVDAYGEATSLQHADAADKSARRKTLRFHTSKIESASARRQGARSNAVGGDDDIPYRDSRKQPAKVVKGRGQGGEDLDEAEPPARNTGAEAEDADGYYELVKRKSKEKKEHKKAEYEAAQEAARYANSLSGFRACSLAVGPTLRLPVPTDHVPSPVRSLPIEGSHLIDPKAFAIRVLRSGRNSRRRRERYHHKRRYTKGGLQRLEDTMGRNPVSAKSSSPCVFDFFETEAAICKLLTFKHNIKIFSMPRGCDLIL